MLLPAPFSPITANVSPGMTCSETSSSANTPGNCFEIPVTAKRAADNGIAAGSVGDSIAVESDIAIVSGASEDRRT
ncbi:hypothetical protein GCM10023156_56010 [Novipirellula rosea]|uniref:Uncharacterized protein n=1 Tax=Novipirellula rosea TaxID=1031540 RepID=A0ABP8NJW7_9BACT